MSRLKTFYISPVFSLVLFLCTVWLPTFRKHLAWRYNISEVVSWDRVQGPSFHKTCHSFPGRQVAVTMQCPVSEYNCSQLTKTLHCAVTGSLSPYQIWSLGAQTKVQRDSPPPSPGHNSYRLHVWKLCLPVLGPMIVTLSKKYLERLSMILEVVFSMDWVWLVSLFIDKIKR